MALWVLLCIASTICMAATYGRWRFSTTMSLYTVLIGLFSSAAALLGVCVDSVQLARELTYSGNGLIVFMLMVSLLLHIKQRHLEDSSQTTRSLPAYVGHLFARAAA